jgi:RNA polymerase sigma-70 factor, ECF subfamily
MGRGHGDEVNLAKHLVSGPPDDARLTPATAEMALAGLAASGDAVATARLVSSVMPRVLRVVRAILGAGHADVDDAVQQALIGFVSSLRNFRGECEPVHFASRIAVRSALAVARRTSRTRDRRVDGVELDTLAADPSAAPEPRADRHRLRRVLRGLLTRIPPEQAEVMALRFVLGASIEETAQLTGVPANTVRSRIRLAKKALRVAIDADPVLSEELELAA